MAEKRGDLTGFDGIQGSHTAKRLRDWGKNQPATRGPGRDDFSKTYILRCTYILWCEDCTPS